MLYRAYAPLEVRTIEGEQRAIEGLATSPTTDRMGDIVESAGATFAKLLPLLLFHDARLPVGTVTLGAPDARGITFRASIPTITESGTLRERLNEAWQSVKAGLIRGVSIGFRPLEDGVEFIKGGGLRFTKFEILELSLVAIPANAEASISTIKAFALPRSRAMTILEQIQTYTSTREAKAARMRDLMAAVAKDGTVLDEAQSAEYDALQTEVAGYDKHIARLQTLETANRADAVPAEGGSSAAAAASRGAAPAQGGGRVSQIYLRAPEPGIEFARMLVCKLIAFQSQQRGSALSPIQVAKAKYPDAHRIHQYLERAAVPAGTTTDPDWAAALVDNTNLTQEFLAWLRPQTIIGKFGTGGVPSLRGVPFNFRIKSATSGTIGYWVGEGQAKPLTKASYGAQTLGSTKVAAITVITDELARFSSPSAEGLLRDDLRDGLVERLDIDFVDPAKAEEVGVSPASITNGVTPITSMAGSTADSIRGDIQALLGAFVTANQSVSDLVIILPNTLALGLSLVRNAMGNPEFPNLGLNGGALLGIPVITSQYAHTAAAGDMVIVLNAKSIGLADDGAVTVEASREASLEMSDAPAGSSGPTVVPVATTQLVSMWQTNSLALRAERFINWKKLRAGAVQYMDQVDWASAGS